MGEVMKVPLKVGTKFKVIGTRVTHLNYGEIFTITYVNSHDRTFKVDKHPDELLSWLRDYEIMDKPPLHAGDQVFTTLSFGDHLPAWTILDVTSVEQRNLETVQRFTIKECYFTRMTGRRCGMCTEGSAFGYDYHFGPYAYDEPINNAFVKPLPDPSAAMEFFNLGKKR